MSTRSKRDNIDVEIVPFLSALAELLAAQVLSATGKPHDVDDTEATDTKCRRSDSCKRDCEERGR